MKNLPVALQVYSVRDTAAVDFAGTLRQVKAIGYDGIELAGLYGQSAKAVRQTADQAGLRIIAAHVPLTEMLADLQTVIADYKILGCEFIAVPHLDAASRPGSANFAQVLQDIARIGSTCHAHGLYLLYHNHDFEFIRMADGSFGLDTIFSQTTPDQLQTELDTCWIKVAGQDPVSYIEKYAGRDPIVHLKDFYQPSVADPAFEGTGVKAEPKKFRREGFEFRPIGHGLQDFPPILDAAARTGASWVVVEQDQSIGRTPLEAARMSREYLRSLGW